MAAVLLALPDEQANAALDEAHAAYVLQGSAGTPRLVSSASMPRCAQEMSCCRQLWLEWAGYLPSDGWVPCGGLAEPIPPRCVQQPPSCLGTTCGAHAPKRLRRV
jgi:hypothetical protein